MEILTGIIQKNATVLAEDGTIHHLPIRGVDAEGYAEVLIDAKEIGGDAWMHPQSVKPYIGMSVEFLRVGKSYQGYNFVIRKKE